MSNLNDSHVVFIVGVGRSGTSLLQRMLNAHKDIRVLPEIHFFKKYLSNRSLIDKYDSQGASRFFQTLKKDARFSRLEKSIDSLEESFSGVANFNVIELYKYILENEKVRSNKIYIGEKDPRLLESISAICSIFPRAKIIHIIRDPRDIMVSKLAASWSSARGFYFNLLITEAQLNYGRKQGAATNNYYELKYENLLTDPESTLNDLCQFIGSYYDRSMLDYHQNDDGLVSSDETQWKQNVLKPLMKGNTNKWASALSPYQIATIERVCVTAFSSGLYFPAKQQSAISFFERIKIELIFLLSSFFKRLYPLLSSRL